MIASQNKHQHCKKQELIISNNLTHVCFLDVHHDSLES